MVQRVDEPSAHAGVTRITSLDDPRVREYRLLTAPAALERAGLFVAEGRWVVQRLLARRQFVTRSVLVTETAHRALSAAVDAITLSDTAVYVVEQQLMNLIVGIDIHRGCLALAERPPRHALTRERARQAKRVVVLEGVNNPDNVGGIFRSAAAFDVDLIVLGPGAGDPLYRKAIRTSMAATLDVPYVESGDWPAALDILRSAGLRVIALTPARDATRLDALPVTERTALLLGTEGAGLTPAALARADERGRIQTSERVDSLNVTVAASIALHHFHTHKVP